MQIRRILPVFPFAFTLGGLLLGSILFLPAPALALPDARISAAVEEELLQDPLVPGRRIDVATEKGIVTLSGTVSSLLAKGRAGRIAETVQGVTLVINHLEVDPPDLVEDLELVRRVKGALLRNAATDSYEIQVSATNGVVTLEGEVESFQEASLAVRVASNVSGVRQVINDIVIDYEGERPDTEIRHDIVEALRWDPLVPSGAIQVDVTNGIAELAGEVPSAAARTLAVSDAWVLGVKEVRADGLRVDPELVMGGAPETTAEEILVAVEGGLLANPAVDATNVEVTVRDRIVTLRGTVDSLQARWEAGSVARLTAGVTRVRNYLRVRPLEVVNDQAVEEEVEEALRNDPIVDGFEIVVSAVDGTVYLNGRVESVFEKNRAREVAGSVAGVVDVENNLAVTDETDVLIYEPYVSELYPYEDDLQVTQVQVRTWKTDAEILEDIGEQMFWSPFVDANEVTVLVEDGTAILTGTVDSWIERNAAVENAFEGGAVWVRDRLNVE